MVIKLTYLEMYNTRSKLVVKVLFLQNIEDGQRLAGLLNDQEHSKKSVPYGRDIAIFCTCETEEVNR